jgi:hypothetical protein
MSEAARKMPVQKPGRSIQNYGTSEVFLLAVRRRFVVYDFAYDLAAETENAKAEHFFCEEEQTRKDEDAAKRLGLQVHVQVTR